MPRPIAHRGKKIMVRKRLRLKRQREAVADDPPGSPAQRPRLGDVRPSTDGSDEASFILPSIELDDLPPDDDFDFDGDSHDDDDNWFDTVTVSTPPSPAQSHRCPPTCAVRS